LQPRPNFLSEIVVQIPIVRGFAVIDTIQRSRRPATGRRTGSTSHLSGIGGVNHPVSTNPGLTVVGTIVGAVPHLRDGPNRFELAGLTTHGCQTLVDVGLAKGGAAKFTVDSRKSTYRIAHHPAETVKEVRNACASDAFHDYMGSISDLPIL